MIEFPFIRRSSKKLGDIFKPIVPVGIVGPKHNINVMMLLDSGADISMIPYSVGEVLGLELNMKTRSEAQGIGEGSVSYVLGSAILRIGHYEIPARIGWALIEEIPLILGRLDIFRTLSIEFRESENRILIRKLRSYNKGLQVY